MDKILAYLASHPEMLKEMYFASSELIDDFDDWGPTIQANINGQYNEETAIERLRKVRDDAVFATEGYRPSEAGSGKGTFWDKYDPGPIWDDRSPE